MQVFLIEKILVEMNIKDRLRQYLDLKGITDYRFQKAIGVTNGYLTKGDTIRSDYLEKILIQYKDLNLIWLLTGEGDMISTEIIPKHVVNTPVESKSLDALAAAEKTNAENMHELIEQCREQTKNITKLVDLLCKSGVTPEIFDEKKSAQFSGNDTDESIAYNAGSANVG